MDEEPPSAYPCAGDSRCFTLRVEQKASRHQAAV